MVCGPKTSLLYTLFKNGFNLEKSFDRDYILNRLEEEIEANKHNTAKFEITMTHMTRDCMIIGCLENLREWARRSPDDFKEWAFEQYRNALVNEPQENLQNLIIDSLI